MDPYATKTLPYAASPKGDAIIDGCESVNSVNADTEQLVFDEFFEKSVRRQFVKKVYTIMTSQLLLTAAIMSIFLFWEPATIFAIQYGSICYSLGTLLLVILIFVFAFSVNARRQWPWNMILLTTFTVVKGVTLGCLSVHYTGYMILMAAGVTVLISLAITLFALQSKWDLTYLTGSCLIFPILITYIILAISLQVLVSSVIWASLGVLFFSFLLLWRTQMIVSGKHRYKFSTEEYIFAALVLYIDIVAIFSCSLRSMR